ncbi:hypothetical protein SAMN05216388_104514 [Halorientalis persicus]|uniref:DUF4350 domain-containing protein n=1 Tax=Halorientalis persicus TaxID=1367881 RepID=A0A1H8W0J6_9EURY|nr:DUF4350 domain-containing protein [Halorientalis persicus]SEP21047.1 hypothetical protein SAMN05216388_104514 [Halorientalis persicus]
MKLLANLPRLLAIGLAIALAVTGIWSASVSVSAFDSYNPGWEGTTQLRGEVDEVGAEQFVAMRISAYDEVDPNATIAVVLSPDQAYTAAEAAQIEQFVRNGGTLVVAEDFGPHSNTLLDQIGARTRVNGRPVRDEWRFYRTPNLAVASGVVESNLTEGIDQITLNYGTVLRPNGSRVLIETSPFAYVDENRNGSLDDTESMRQYPVATIEDIGAGQAIVVADPSVFINAMINREQNREFARALLEGHSTVLFDYTNGGNVPPLVEATIQLQRNDPIAALVGIGLLGVVALAVPRLVVIGSRKKNRENVSRSNNTPKSSWKRVRNGIAQRNGWDRDRLDRLMEQLEINDGREDENDD